MGSWGSSDFDDFDMCLGFIEKTLQPKFQVHRTIGCRDLAVLNWYKIQTGYFTGQNSNSYNFGLA